MAEKLDEQWSELRRIVTIETDPQKLAQLASELDRRKRQAAGALQLTLESQNRRCEPRHDQP
jgi:hypothetical protein